MSRMTFLVSAFLFSANVYSIEMYKLALEVQVQILSTLSAEDVNNISMVSSEFNQVYQSSEERIWHFLVDRDFGSFFIQPCSWKLAKWKKIYRNSFFSSKENADYFKKHKKIRRLGHFRNCNGYYLVGADFSGVDFNPYFSDKTESLYLTSEKIHLDHANLANSDFSGTKLEEHHISLSGANISGALFFGCKFSKLMSDEEKQISGASDYNIACKTVQLTIEILKGLGTTWNEKDPPILEDF